MYCYDGSSFELNLASSVFKSTFWGVNATFRDHTLGGDNMILLKDEKIDAIAEEIATVVLLPAFLN